MTRQWRRLCLCGAIGLSVLFVLFPPFSVNGGPDEYGFALAAPPSARQAMAMMSGLGGAQGRALATGLVHYAVDPVRLLVQLAVVWLAYAAVRLTVLGDAPGNVPADRTRP